MNNILSRLIQSFKDIEFQIRLLSVTLECLKVSEVKEAARRDVRCLGQGLIQISLRQNVCCAAAALTPTLAR